jgi:hypothetical protein
MLNLFGQNNITPAEKSSLWIFGDDFRFSILIRCVLLRQSHPIKTAPIDPSKATIRYYGLFLSKAYILYLY